MEARHPIHPIQRDRSKWMGHKNELCFFWNTLLGSIKELIITMTSMTTITSMTTMATMTTMTTES